MHWVKPMKSVNCTSPLRYANEKTEAKKVQMPNLRPTTKTISLRLPQHLLDSIKMAANVRDVPYQSLIKVWLQEKLQHG
jgi:predicted DNA binding CopG/RHH family protein